MQNPEHRSNYMDVTMFEAECSSNLQLQTSNALRLLVERLGQSIDQ